ncbi:MAG: RNA polymerase sigma factor [Pseudomonadota bacterium]
MSMESVDDRELLRRVGEGDKAALRTLYEAHRGSLLAFLRGKCRDEELAKDALHDAMIEVWSSAARFAGASSPKTWMFAIARNKLADRLRKESRLSVVEELPEIVDDAPDPTLVIERSENAARVRSCLAKLSERHRTVIVLAFFHAMKYEEISKVEGTAVGTIKTRIHHAKKLLLHCLGGR